MATTNYLSPASFDISIAKMPNVEFFAQQVSIPSVDSQGASFESPLKTLYNVTDKLVYGYLEVNIIVDENMNNYREILEWLEGMGSPETRGDQYNRKKEEVSSYYSDITVIVHNSKKNPNKRFVFKNAFPISIGPIDLDIRQETITYVTSNVVFRYDNFVLEDIEE